MYAEIAPIRKIQTTLSQQYYFHNMTKNVHLKIIENILYMKNRADHVKVSFRCVEMADINAL